MYLVRFSKRAEMVVFLGVLMIKHRPVYEMYENTENLLSPDGTPYDGVIRVIRMWTHYE